MSGHSHIATDGQSVSQSVFVFVLSTWGASSDERTGLSFVRGDWSNSCPGLYSRDRSPPTFLPRRFCDPHSSSGY
jgi:hypothetical protein